VDLTELAEQTSKDNTLILAKHTPSSYFLFSDTFVCANV